MDRITTDLERKLDRQLTIAIDGLRLIEYAVSTSQARAIAQSILDQMQASTLDCEEGDQG